MSSDSRVKNTPSAIELEERLFVYRKRIAELMRSPALTAGNLDEAIREATELSAALLDVDRASVWRYDANRRHIECTDLFVRPDGQHSSGAVIESSTAPAYFDALAEERCIAARDARTDRRTQEFTSSYLEPLGIGAMLDAPIWVRGTMVGVVCNEHVGEPRQWTVVEELLAGTIADFVARVIELSDHVRIERDLGARRQELEELLHLRTSELNRINSALDREVKAWQAAEAESQDLRDIFDGSPIPFVLTNFEDAVIRYANRRALELFEGGRDEVVGRRAPDFYVEPEQRQAFLDELRRRGRVDGFVAKLKTQRGRHFHALMSAETMNAGGERLFMVGFSDVTAQKLAEDAVRQNERNVRALFETAPVPLILSRVSDSKVVLANQRAADLFAISLTDVLGQTTPDFYADPEVRPELLQRLVQDGHYNGEEVRLRASNGRIFWALMSGRITDYEGQTCALTGVLDVSEQKALEEQLRDLAATDPLTGVANRRTFMEAAAKEILRSDRGSTPLSLCCLDADHFKRINDAHGHAAGDEVLVHIARAAQAELRAHDLLARVGGEEFSILLPDTNAGGAAAMAERIRERVRNLNVLGADVRVTLSLGIAQRAPGESLDQWLARADRALYGAKQAGRDRVSHA